jgi:putative phosphoserine phosphatase/1-acylglycerol-3-phosphate O-acyltransferase
VATAAPIAAGAIGLGLLTRSKRAGLNFFTQAFGRSLMSAIGIRLNVLGRENLTKQRPAVFIFNHRNQADPLIAGHLVDTDFTSVGKKELEKDPIVGTLGKVMDAAFIDRDDPTKAVEELKKVEELARKGLSILIAPEGTRLDTTEVGPFKKGPFRIAMSVGIPIVPIVIRNAEVIAARDSTTFNPGTVDVVVYPPIPVDDWTHENLNERIDEVRQLYLDTLKNWPRGELPTPALYERSQAPAEKSSAKKAPAKKAPAKKAPAKKAPAKKATAKKATTKKATAKKASAKKTPAEKAPARKATAKKTTPGEQQ